MPPSSRSQPLVLPHDIIPWLVEHGVFPTGIEAEDEVAKYWQHIESMGLPTHGASHKHVPLYVWGDDAQFTENNDKLVCVSFGRSLETGKNSLIFCWPLFVFHHVPWPICLCSTC